MAVKRVYNGIRFTIAKDYDEMSKIAAKLILQVIKKNKKSKKRLSLLVPTGTTPKGVYKILSMKSKRTFSNVQFFNMDEYCYKKGKNLTLIEPTSRRSYRYYMHRNLFDNIGYVPHHFPTLDNFQEKGFYDNFIKRKGGIDLCLNAMGENGHTFGFNFPDTQFNSKTRLVKIDQNTKKVNKKLTHSKIPNYAITTGIKTGMSAKQIIFLVSGKRKANILKKVIYGPIDKKVPASVLRKHKKCIWIIDEEAASKL